MRTVLIFIKIKNEINYRTFANNSFKNHILDKMKFYMHFNVFKSYLLYNLKCHRQDTVILYLFSVNSVKYAHKFYYIIYHPMI